MMATSSVFRLFFFKKWGSELTRNVNSHPNEFSLKNCIWSPNWQKWQDCKWSLNWVRYQEMQMVTLLSSVPWTVHNTQNDLGDKKGNGQKIQLGSVHCMWSPNRGKWKQCFCITNGTRITNLHHSYFGTVAVLNS